MKVRSRETYDSSATPKVGQKLRPPKKLAEVDLSKLRARISATIEKSKAEDPRELRKRIVELEQQVRQAATAKPRIERVEVPVLREADVKQLMKAVTKLSETGTALAGIAQEISATIAKVSANGGRPPAAAEQNGSRPRLPGRPARQLKVLGPPTDVKLSGGERKILAALAQYPRGRSKTQVAILTGYSHKGGAFNNYLSALRSKGLIEGSGENLRITERGLATGPYEPLPSGREFIEFWMRQLGKAERAILASLIEVYPSSLTKEDVARVAGYEPNGGGFNNALSKLRTLELIRGRGAVTAAVEFFQP